MGSVWACERFLVEPLCIYQRSLCGVNVGDREIPEQDQCESVFDSCVESGWICGRFPSEVSGVSVWVSVGLTEVSV